MAEHNTPANSAEPAGRETMTSRERVIRTLNREPVDRMPIDLGGYTASGISAFAYWNLRKHLGLPEVTPLVQDTVQVTARVDTDVLERFHCDVISFSPGWENPMVWNPYGEYRFIVPEEMDPTLNEKGEWIVTRGDQRMRMPANGYFFDGDWMSRWEQKPEEEVLELCTRYAEEIYKETPYACIFKGVPQGLSFASYFGGIEFACRMYTDPDAIHAENEAKCAESIRTFDNVNKAFGPWIQMVAVGDDMGTQQGPMCAPQLMEELCMPYYARFCRHVHENSDIKVFMHNCGSIRPLIPLLIEAGIDVLNPVQISADDMDPFDLKREFGDRIVFWGGGCNTQAVLGSGTPADVQQNVEHLVGAFKPGGGYVFNQVHNIVGNVPPENIVGMLDTAYRESFY